MNKQNQFHLIRLSPKNIMLVDGNEVLAVISALGKADSNTLSIMAISIYEFIGRELMQEEEKDAVPSSRG